MRRKLLVLGLLFCLSLSIPQRSEAATVPGIGALIEAGAKYLNRANERLKKILMDFNKEKTKILQRESEKIRKEYAKYRRILSGAIFSDAVLEAGKTREFARNCEYVIQMCDEGLRSVAESPFLTDDERKEFLEVLGGLLEEAIALSKNNTVELLQDKDANLKMSDKQRISLLESYYDESVRLVKKVNEIVEVYYGQAMRYVHRQRSTGSTSPLIPNEI